jgi:hypothetical protein
MVHVDLSRKKMYVVFKVFPMFIEYVTATFVIKFIFYSSFMSASALACFVGTCL